MKTIKRFPFILLLLLSTLSIGQDQDSIYLQAALDRYPMLEVCEVPGFPEKILCGQLMVNEDHSATEGKKIPIDVIVLPAITEQPENSAFTYHWGGNGAAAKEKIWSFRHKSLSHKIRDQRDIVLIDDRGNGMSKISCAAMDSLKPKAYALVYDEKLISDCLDEVKGKVNLALYNTPAIVKDYDAVRQWLGLEQFDFYGVSYGVRVGLEYMRQYPDKVRTLTVKGSVPPDFNYINEMDVEIENQLNSLISRCKADTNCAEYYPNFKEELYTIRNRLKEEPKQIDYILESGESVNVTIDDLTFRRMVGHLILNGYSNEDLPLIIHRAYNGNFVPLITLASGSTLNIPIFFSQFCPEEVDRFPFLRESFNADDLFTQGAIGEEKILACNWWMPMPKAHWLDEPLKSNNPILILTGEYDANTPIRMGEQIKDAFPTTSRHIILPHQGHFSTKRGCLFDMISQFVNSKSLQSLDITCLQDIKPALFSYEETLNVEAFKKYAGDYVAEEPGKILQIVEKQGVFFLYDEFSRFAGPSQLLYRGSNTFGLLDCDHCKIEFKMNGNEVKEVKRIYDETITFKLEKL